MGSRRANQEAGFRYEEDEERSMGLKDQLSAEQFRAAYNAPLAAATYVSTASGGGFEMVSELLSAGKFIGEQLKAGGETGYGEVVDGLLADLRGMSRDEAKAETVRYEGKDPAALRGQARQIVVDAWTAVGGMSGADGFARWILDIAQAVAAAKTGGFLGIGAKSVVDAQEQAALDDLAAALRLSPTS
jgi:hypothetical protein